MEFHEKLQELRKSRGLTQEELAEDLYVSRTAISKWESGRGYPNIDSLKEISKYFSVSIDNLLSGEKLLSIAEEEKESSIRSLCNLLFGITDILGVMLIIPLYPKTIDRYIYSVNLLAYVEKTTWNRLIYWIVILSLILLGMIKLWMAKSAGKKKCKIVTGISVGIHVLGVIIFAMTREAYATAVIFMLLVTKGILLFRGGRVR